MAIPKIIIQTFKTSKLPWLTRFYINRFRRRNPSYAYEFYDDKAISAFLSTEFDDELNIAYHRLNIGAAKADLFRYAVLYKKGGVYLDIDGTINCDLDNFILPGDDAILTRERNPGLFVQWALLFSPGHAILKHTIDRVKENILENKYPNDVHKMTGPTVYSEAVHKYISDESNLNYRIAGIDYEGKIKPKYPLNKLLLYGNRSEHWKVKQQSSGVIKPGNNTLH